MKKIIFLLLVIFVSINPMQQANIKEVSEVEKLINNHLKLDEYRSNSALQALIKEIGARAHQLTGNMKVNDQVIKKVADEICDQTNLKSYANLPQLLYDAQNAKEFISTLVKKRLSYSSLKTNLESTPKDVKERCIKPHLSVLDVIDVISDVILRQNDANQDELIDIIEFSPDDKFVAVSTDKILKIIEIKTGKIVRTINHGVRIYSIVFSPNGKSIALVGYPHVAKIYNIKTGDVWINIDGGDLNSITFSPNGRYVAIAIAGFEGEVRVIDLSNGNITQTIDHGNECINSVKFSPNGQWIATASNDCTAKVTEIGTGRLIQTIRHEYPIKNLSFSPDSEYLYTSCLWPMRKVTQISTNQNIQIDDIDKIIITQQDGKFITHEFGEFFKVRDKFTAKILQRLSLSHNEFMGPQSYSSDSKLIATGSHTKSEIFVRITPILKNLKFEQLNFLYELSKLEKVTKYPTIVLNEKDQKIYDSLPAHLKPILLKKFNFTRNYTEFVLNKIKEKKAEIFSSLLAVCTVAKLFKRPFLR